MAYRGVIAGESSSAGRSAGLSADTELLSLADLADRCLDGADCLYDRGLHDGPDDPGAESSAERAVREQVAAEVCSGCLVRVLCLEYALLARPARGVWAGLTASEIGAVADALASGDAAEGRRAE